MRNRKLIYVTIGILSVLLVIVMVIIFRNKNNVPLEVVFLDVGQGDSILISEGSQQLLIDGGKDGKLLLEKLGKHIPFWDRKIETIIETHPDADHIGGLIDVLNVYGVDSVIETKMQSDSQTFKKLGDVIASKNIQKIEAKKDVSMKFANDAVAEILYPFDTVTDVNGKDTNMYSVVVKLTVGKSKFLFTGDLPIDQEKEIIARLNPFENIGADVLKIGHHGSKYSTSEEFLNAIRPTDAIISVGKNNSYGHPNQEVLKRLLQHHVNILRTDEVGDIVYECQGLNSKCFVKSN